MAIMRIQENTEEEKRADRIWKQFYQSLLHENRFFLSNGNEMFQFLEEIGAKASVTHRRNRKLFRGRIAGGNREYNLFDANDMLAPQAKDSVCGRANVLGVPVLYTAEDKVTAIAELRAWLSSRITLATLQPISTLRLVDLTKHKCLESNLDLTGVSLMRKVDNAFSTPLSEHDAKLHYIPTQYIASFFKSMGYAGIRYRSAMHQGGINVALFDTTESVKVIDVKDVEIMRIKYTSRITTHPSRLPGFKFRLADE